MKNRRIAAIVAVAGIVLFPVWGMRQAAKPLSCPAIPPLPTENSRVPVSNPLQIPSVKAEVIIHGLRSVKKIALTFDACSTRNPSDYDDRVTRVLVETKTPATIFLGGKWIQDEEAHARYLTSLPQFELGNHTFFHPHLREIPDAQVRDELRRTQEALIKITGRPATLFRPPYGEYDSRVVRIAAEMGLSTIEYDLASGDPDIHATKEKLIEYVTSSARSGSIVVMHINRRGWHTAEALPDIISILRKRGYQLVTVGELLRDMGKGKVGLPAGSASHHVLELPPASISAMIKLGFRS
jgi:peptidoglycan/xylan/chitin deacetylase (PgdA/CDA1 family)